MENQSEIRKEVSKTLVSVDRVYVSDFQKEGTKTAQLRQVIKTTSFYPTKQISSNLQGNPFALTDFDASFKE